MMILWHILSFHKNHYMSMHTSCILRLFAALADESPLRRGNVEWFEQKRRERGATNGEGSRKIISETAAREAHTKGENVINEENH